MLAAFCCHGDGGEPGGNHGTTPARQVDPRDCAPNRPFAQLGSCRVARQDGGWLYLAVVLDLFNREIVGWSLKPRMTADIVRDALTMAWFSRKPVLGLIDHSDRGSQYASHAFKDKLKEFGTQCSMRRKGDRWDNAPTKSFFNRLKNERAHGTRYATREEATNDIFEYIEAFYNRKRLHSTLGYVSPQTYLQNWTSAQHGSERAA